LFLKDNKRIAALLFIVYLALLIYCLIEREIRLALAPEGGKMRGLNGNTLGPDPPAAISLSLWPLLPSCW
jgi:transposase